MRIAVLLSAAFFMAGTGRAADAKPGPAPASDWLWPAPRKPQSTIIRRAQGSKILQTPKVAVLDGGELLVLLTHNNYASDAVVSNVTIESFVSVDGGVTWERRQPTGSQAAAILRNYPSPPIRLKEGTLLAVGSRGWENFADTEEKRKELAHQGYYVFTHEEGNAVGVISIIHRAWTSRSADGGRTWQTSDIGLPAFMPHLASYGDAIVLRDGTIVQPMWGRFDLKREPRYVSSLVLRSEDGGAHWDLRTIAKAKDFDFNETSLTRAANGDLVALIRTTGQRELWSAISKDGGKTWSPPRDSGMRGSTPWLVTTKDGLVVAVYIRRETKPGGGGFDRTGVFACVSRDNGHTWQVRHQVMLLDGGTEFVDGYPCAVALPDGSVYAVYGFHGASAIGGTRFHPGFPDFGPG